MEKRNRSNMESGLFFPITAPHLEKAAGLSGQQAARAPLAPPSLPLWRLVHGPQSHIPLVLQLC